MIEIKNLTKFYGRNAAVKNLSFTVNDNEILGFLGPNGAGKSTTMNIITGFLPSTSGTVTINGLDISENPSEAKKMIGYLPEIPPVYLDMKVKEYLKFVAGIKGVKRNERNQQVESAMEKLKIKDVEKRLIRNLSKGYRQRVGFAQALLGDPKYLILDEPTNGLDPAGIKELRDILKNLAHKENICVIVSSHLMSEMELMCDRVGIIVNGKLTGVHTVEEMISAASGDKEQFILRVSDCQRAIEVLDFISDKSVLDDGHITISVEKENAEEELFEITSRIISRGIKLGTVAPKENKKLEDVFIELTKSGGSQIG